MSEITTKAQDAGRELAIRARLAIPALIERAKEQRGQTAAEYMGVLLLVSVIIGFVAASGVGEWIAEGVEDLVKQIAGGGDKEGGGVEVGD
jgi:hypothetical protein